jgi:predicted O-methyltransferase YrrM
MQTTTYERSARETNASASPLQRKLASAKVAGQRVLNYLTDESPLREMSRRQGLVGTFLMEGHIKPEQYYWFAKLFRNEDIAYVVETGFNAGHSAFAFANLGAWSITSFDKGEHHYVKPAHEYLVNRFPNTLFNLVIGDSVETVRSYEDSPVKNDLAFIDGGHDPVTSLEDLVNLRRLVKPGGLVVMDDYGHDYSWQFGPTQAFNHAVEVGYVTPLDVEMPPDASWAVGRYAV